MRAVALRATRQLLRSGRPVRQCYLSLVMKRLSRILWLTALLSLWVPSIASAASVYLINSNDQTAYPSDYLDIKVYAASTGGVWRLVDGDTYVNQFGFDTTIRGLLDGVSLDSIVSSTRTTLYAYTVP